MITFGLTGGIASGKSTVARLFAQSGIPVVDADRVARRVVEPGSVALNAIVSEFGPEVLGRDGALDRSALGRIVFSDEKKRQRLNGIVHPEVKKLVVADLARLSIQGHELACYDVPLLFETNQDRLYRPVVVVTASDETRITRMVERDGLSREEAAARLASQMPLAEKVLRADVVIENEGDLESLHVAAQEALVRVRRLVGLAG